ncbi:hypothetical protein ACIOG8_14695 [Streptomyces erythrochromogenes]|uniref:hypothetical protein n=1 Tax=Streptomyces erythrochromogenes TaxID=285574 RepID=UPI00381DE16F
MDLPLPLPVAAAQQTGRDRVGTLRPGARLVELPTGQIPFAERPAEWAAPVTAFLSGPAAR